MVIKLTLTIINIEIQVEIKSLIIAIRPEVVIFTSNKSVNELLDDKQSLNNEKNNIAFRNRVIEIELEDICFDSYVITSIFEFNANLFQRIGQLTDYLKPEY